MGTRKRTTRRPLPRPASGCPGRMEPSPSERLCFLTRLIRHAEVYGWTKTNGAVILPCAACGPPLPPSRRHKTASSMGSGLAAPTKGSANGERWPSISSSRAGQSPPRRGMPLTEKDAADLYLCCLAKVLGTRGIEAPHPCLPDNPAVMRLLEEKG